MPDPFWERAPKGKLHRPDGPEQEVLANGMQCGDRITGIIKGWWESEYGPLRGDIATQFAAALKYPIDLPTDIVEGNNAATTRTCLLGKVRADQPASWSNQRYGLWLPTLECTCYAGA